jgi:uncharacterized Fe-S cluster protein YjdI
MEKKIYRHESIAVSWEPGLCMHSTRCWKNLKAVFDPTRKPWIQLENGEKDTIRERVLDCPSGALKWVSESEIHPDPEPISLVVEVTSKGPLLISGPVSLLLPDGTRQESPGPKTALCRCGAYSKKPFCDGSHRSTPFQD